MRKWNDRVVEEANLFNPAFCVTLLSKTADDFVKKAGRPFPFPLAFLVLPIVLHPTTRVELPHSTVASVLMWTQEHREVLVRFAEHVRLLRPITQEALLFGLSHNVLALDDEGSLLVAKDRVTPTERRTDLFTSEARECVDRAGFVGRWFATSGNVATIFATLGIGP